MVAYSPPSFWIKINFNGPTHGALGLDGAGGVFYDHRGVVQVCFAFHIDSAYAFEAKLKAVIEAVSYTYAKRWHLF